MPPHSSIGRLAAVVSCAAITWVVGTVPSAHAKDSSGVASHPMYGEPAPGFHLRTVTGDTLSLEDLKGKYVVLHFGASW